MNLILPCAFLSVLSSSLQDVDVSRLAAGPAEAALQSGLPWALLPRAETSFGAELHRGWLYMLGGYHGTPHEYKAAGQSGDFLRISTVDPSVVERLPSPGPAQSLSLDGHDGSIWRVGGMQIQDTDEFDSELFSLSRVERLDLGQMEWISMPDLPLGRSSHETALVKDKLFVIGGWCMKGDEGEEWADDALVLDLTNPEGGWKSIPQPFQRRALAATGTTSHVVAIGGIASDRSTPQRVDVYDPESETWSQGPEFPGGGFAAMAEAVGDRVYATGRDGSVYSWAVGQPTWVQEQVDLTFPRFFGHLVGDESALYLLGGIGGMNRSGRIRAIERLPFGSSSKVSSVAFGLPLPAAMTAEPVTGMASGVLLSKDSDGKHWGLRLSDLSWKEVPESSDADDAKDVPSAAEPSLFNGRRVEWELLPNRASARLHFHLMPR